MRAAIFEEAGKPLRVQEVATPTLGSGEVLVRVAACGICHTDLHYIDHGVPTFKTPPLILGHEASGVVEEVGPGVERLERGARVLIPAVVTCGSCVYCRTGRENICERQAMFGNHVDGAYAQYVKAPAKDLFLLPPELPLEEACIIADAISTPFHAVTNRGQVRPGDRVVVIGCGGVGINIVQIAAALGAVVFAVDIAEEKLELARKLGATETINPQAVPQVAKAIKQRTEGGADVAFEAIGKPETILQAFDTLRRGGRLCIVGYSHLPAEFNVAKVMFFEMEVVGSLGCRPVDYPRIIEMVRLGRLRLEPLISHRLPLEEINYGLDLVRQGVGIRNIVLPNA